VLGFCIGGSYALLAAAELAGLSCAVTFYGMLRYPELTSNKPVSPLDAAAEIACPVLGHFGEADHLVPVADARELGERLAGRPAEVYTYPGAGHAFHEDFRAQVYRPVAAATAWSRSREYLSWYLRDEVSRQERIPS
jgi:carboxymethylenebutenolidase